MTHNTDCTVREEFREVLDEIAREFWEGNIETGKEMAEGLGYEQVGAGAGRTVFRVPVDEQVGETGSPITDAPCVVKFATPGHTYNGRLQNREEISQYQQFPDRIKAAEPPVIVPVKDWDNMEYHWLTMPEANQRGSAMEAQHRLAELGYECDDLHSDNVGEMHGTGVVLDYGLECREADRPIEIAEEIADVLESLDARAVSVGGDGTSSHVSWLPPAWVADGDPDTESGVSIEAGRGIIGASFTFGTWIEDERGKIEQAGEEVAERLNEDWLEMRVVPRVKDADGGIELILEIENHAPVDEQMDGWIFGDFYEDALGWVEEYIDAANDPRQLANELRPFFNDETDTDPSPYDKSGPRHFNVTFYPGEDENPGFQTPHYTSHVGFDTRGFSELVVVVGPWREDEPHFPTLSEAATEVMERMQNAYPEYEVEWVRLSAPPVATGEELTEEIQFSIDTPEDEPHTADLTPAQITEMYAGLMRLMGVFPTAREKGSPPQETLDEFEEVPVAERVNRRIGTEFGTERSP